MKKYLGLIVLVALLSSSFLAVRAAPDDQRNRKGGAVNDAQIGQLDKRLSERIIEQQELLAMVEKLLGMNFAQKVLSSPEADNILSGRNKAPVAPVAVAKTAPVPVASPPPPWWQSYRTQMVYLSGNDRYAVVNGKMFVVGQTLGNDVVVDKIEDDAVVLRHGTEHHTYFLKK